MALQFLLKDNNFSKYAQEPNCTMGGMDDFPKCFLDSYPRYDYVLLCFLLNMYLFLGVAIICDEYCVPCVERLCYNLHMSYDIAGASFLALATTAPELFVHLYATFLTKGDMGIGAIVGASTFNALAVTALSGFVAGANVYLDWWPLSRDLIWYTINIVLLTLILKDNLIYWHEAILLLLSFVLNMVNLAMDKPIQQLIRDPDSQCACICCVPLGPVQDFVKMPDPDNAEEKPFNLLHWPKDSGGWAITLWILSYPWELLFSCSIPNVKNNDWSKFYVLGFTMSVVWIFVLTYFISWMLTVVGYYLLIPESIVGLTLTAFGTSLPEAISSIIVVKKGYGSMALCNAVGSNNFNIAFCLSIPWFIKIMFFPSNEDSKAILINSGSLFYSTSVLIATVIVVYGSFLITRFQLDLRIGIICMFSYLSYLVMAIYLEMYWFKAKKPLCLAVTGMKV